MQSPDVFICHAGAQKKEFVDSLRVLLQQYHRLDVVVSEDGLKFGDDAPRVTQQQLEAAAVAVVVLSPEFLTRKALLDEVRCILNQRRSNGDKQKICVVFHKVTVEQCSAMNAEGALTEYREDIRELCRFTCIREDKAGFYQGEQVLLVVNTVIAFLKEAGRLPAQYGGGPQNRVLRMHSELIGRDSELQQVLQELEVQRWAAIVGGPGEGKSALAAELAHTLYANGQLPGGAYPVDLSLADTEAALADQVAAQLINQLGNMEGAGKLAASPTWASLVQWLNRNDHALLLVLENVEAVIEHQKEALRQLVKDMQQCKSVRLLLISRLNYLADLSLQTLPLKQLDSESAVALLRTRCTQAGNWAPQQAERLAELCRFNALLLTIMSGLINGGRCSIEDALADAEQGGPLSLLEGARAGGALDDHQIRHADAWLLKHLSPREQEAIARLSLFRGSISLDNTLLMVGAPAESSPQLQEMLDRFVLQRSTSDSVSASKPRFSMNPVIWDFAERIRAAQPPEQQAAAQQQFLRCMLALADRYAQLSPKQGPGGMAEALQLLSDELPNFQAMRAMLAANAVSLELDEVMLARLSRFATALHERGQYVEAAQQHRQVVELSQKVLGPEHPNTLASMNNLAEALRDMGRHAEAAQQHRQVLELSQKSLGLKHPDTLASTLNLANALANLGQHAEATQQYRQVVELSQKVLGPEHPKTLASKHNLAITLQAMGRHAEAAQQHREVLELRQKVLGPEHPDTLASMNILAIALHAMGRHAEAAQQFRQVLELRQKVLGPEHPNTLASMNNLAEALREALHAMGQHAAAAQQLRQVLELRQKVLGPEHPNTLNSMNNLANVLHAMGQHAQTAQLHRQVLELMQKVLGPEHPDTLTSMTNLAIALHAMGQHAAAAQQLRQVLELRQKVLGPEHPETLSSMNNQAVALQAMGQHTEAAQQHRQVLELRQKVLGPEHPDTLTSMNNLAEALRGMGQHAEAGKQHRQVLQLRQQVLGPGHPDTIASMRACAGSAQSTYTVQALHRLQNALSWLYRGVLVDGRTSALLLTSLVVLLVALAGAWHLDAGVSQVVLYQRGPMPSTAGGAAFALDAPVQPGYWIAAYYPTEHDSGSLVECIEVELARVIDRSAIDVQSAVNASTAIYVHVLHSPADKITLWQLQQALRDDFERVFMTGGPGWQGGGEVYEVKQKGGVLSLSIFKRPPSVRDALYVIVPAGDGAKFMVIHGSNLLRHANLVYKWRIGNFGKLHVLDLVNKHSLEQLKLQKLVAEQDSIVTRPPEPPLMGSQPMYLELWQGQLPVGPPIPVSWPSLVEVLWMAVLQHKLAVLLALAMLPLIWVCLYKRSVEQPSLPGSPAPESRPAVGSPASSSAGAEKETWIFVCHAGPDNPTAEDLRRALNRDGLKLFVDQDDIPMGMAGDDVMSRAMAISQAAIILLSEDLLVDTALIAAVCKLVKAHQQRRLRFLLPVFLRLTRVEAADMCVSHLGPMDQQVFNHLQRHAGVHHKGEYEPGASFQPQTPQTLQRRVADAVRSWKL